MSLLIPTRPMHLLLWMGWSGLLCSNVLQWTWWLPHSRPQIIETAVTPVYVLVVEEVILTRKVGLKRKDAMFATQNQNHHHRHRPYRHVQVSWGLHGPAMWNREEVSWSRDLSADRALTYSKSATAGHSNKGRSFIPQSFEFDSRQLDFWRFGAENHGSSQLGQRMHQFYFIYQVYILSECFSGVELLQLNNDISSQLHRIWLQICTLVYISSIYVYLCVNCLYYIWFLSFQLDYTTHVRWCHI